VAGVRQEAPCRESLPPREYLIYFIERPDRNWWDWVFRTREGFRHCFAMQFCEWSNRWIMIDWRQYRTDCMVLFDFEAQAMISHVGQAKGTVVRFWPTEEPCRGGLITYCSNMISRVLGLGNKVILTPYGLYRTLIAAGGEVVYCWRDEHEQERETIEGIQTT